VRPLRLTARAARRALALALAQLAHRAPERGGRIAGGGASATLHGLDPAETLEKHLDDVAPFEHRVGVAVVRCAVKNRSKMLGERVKL
jgi:hypothetical protein